MLPQDFYQCILVVFALKLLVVVHTLLQIKLDLLLALLLRRSLLRLPGECVQLVLQLLVLLMHAQSVLLQLAHSLRVHPGLRIHRFPQCGLPLLAAFSQRGFLLAGVKKEGASKKNQK